MESEARHIFGPKTYNMERNKLHALWIRQMLTGLN